MLLSQDLVMETCLLAGEIMLRSGAETYRVEDTMALIAKAANMDGVHSSCTPTSIIFSFCAGNSDRTRMIRVKDRTFDLSKVTMVNEVSRRFVSGSITLQDAYQRLQTINQMKSLYPAWLQHMAAGLASGSFTVLIGGTVLDFFPTILAAILVNLGVFYFQQVLQVKFFAEFMAGLFGGFITLFSFRMIPGLHLDLMLIGTMIPLFPGIIITNSLRDLMAGDYVAGVTRGAEAILTALSVALAAAIVLSFAR